jgi:fused signal recognition particle receptor
MSIFQKIKKIFKVGNKLPADIISSIEESLINSDASFSVIKKVITPDLQRLDTAEEVKAKVAQRMISILQPRQKKIEITSNPPFVIFIFGVNGSGKTTTIAKLANKFIIEGKRVLIGACDTFRAAAAQQMEYWSNKIGAFIEKPLKEGEDPSAVAFRSLKRAIEEKFDVLIIDTSGRLQTNKSLMEELSKMQSVLRKIDEEKPDLNLLVIDASSGQNAISQAREFGKGVKLDGIIITKLDSSSKGGTILTIASELDHSIYQRN